MRDKPENLNGPIPWIRIEDFDGKFLSGSKSTQGVSLSTVREMNLKVLQPGTVLCSCSCNMGATAIVREPLVCNQTFIGITPGRRLESGYLYYLMQVAKQHLTAEATGAIQQYLSKNDFARLRVPLPRLEEQTAASDFLDRETAKIDALVAAKHRLLCLAAEQNLSAIDGLLRHHPQIRLRFLINHLEQGWSPQCEERAASENEWAVLKVGCVNGGVFNDGEHKALPVSLDVDLGLEVRPGDLLVSRASGSPELVGSAAVVRSCRSKLLLSDKLFRLTTNTTRTTGDYLALALGSKSVRAQIEAALSGGSGLANNISQEALLNLSIPICDPSAQVLVLQRAAAVTQREHAIRAKLDRAQTGLLEYRSALITAAVTGQIDVRRASGFDGNVLASSGLIKANVRSLS